MSALGRRAPEPAGGGSVSLRCWTQALVAPRCVTFPSLYVKQRASGSVRLEPSSTAGAPCCSPGLDWLGSCSAAGCWLAAGSHTVVGGQGAAGSAVAGPAVASFMYHQAVVMLIFLNVLFSSVPACSVVAESCHWVEALCLPDIHHNIF